VASNLSVPATGSGGIAAPDTAARPGLRNTVVLFYAGLALAALIPGLVLKSGFDVGDQVAVGPALAALQRTLADIEFGSGLRFWLGVTGATMMALLLLYPLRKMFAKERKLGSVGGWFHGHILFGMFGPVLILYHCNFGLGGSNANVALWAMLTVAASGLVGQFVYGRASRDFYSGKQQARQHREAMFSTLSTVDRLQAGRDKLAGNLDAFEAELLTPGIGLRACLRARLQVESRNRTLAQEISWLVDESARDQGLGSTSHRQLRAGTGRHVRGYFDIARAAASQSIREQLWARWRLFHLPVFLVMVVAAILHVVAVWDMDAPGRADNRPATMTAAADVPARTKAPRPGKVEPKPAAIATGAGASGQPTSSRGLVEVKPPPATETPAQARMPEPATAPLPMPMPPVLVTRPRPVAIPAPTPEVARPVAAAPRVDGASQAATAEPVKQAPSVIRSVPATAAPAPAQPDLNAVYKELQRRTEMAPMSLGGAKSFALSDQIAQMKARQGAGQFSHSEAETGFARTGKHLKADCTACHKAPLRETRQNEPRQCVSCHEKDDVHRGRRPDCANCHTTNRWTQILRRR
jgi:hypothetical protein